MGRREAAHGVCMAGASFFKLVSSVKLFFWGRLRSGLGSVLVARHEHLVVACQCVWDVCVRVRRHEQARLPVGRTATMRIRYVENMRAGGRPQGSCTQRSGSRSRTIRSTVKNWSFTSVHGQCDDPMADLEDAL